jgi:hypothetical protein
LFVLILTFPDIFSMKIAINLRVVSGYCWVIYCQNIKGSENYSWGGNQMHNNH